MNMPSTRQRTRQFLPLFLAVLAVLPAWASAPTPPEAVKACFACHGPAGISVAAHIPNLAGQKSAYIEGQLAAFHGGTRSHDVMSAIAKQLSAAERKALAAHFSALPAGAPGATTPAEAVRFGTLEFPRDYPAGFTAYLETTEAGLRKVFLANDAAMKSIGTGKPPANGAAVVVENRRLAEGSAESVAGYAVMQVGAGWGAEVPEILRNGDWRYGLFTASKQPRTVPAPAECLACHKPKAAEAYVFTHAALVQKAGGMTR
jgi:cytochrome c553